MRVPWRPTPLVALAAPSAGPSACLVLANTFVTVLGQTEAKRALESSQAAALSSASHRDSQQLRDIFQEETSKFEAQHEQEAEHLRVAWVLELKVWGDSVVMLRNRLHQKTPDASWLSDLLRKAHRAQRCYETAAELEAFLTKFCADPEQPLLPDIWSKDASCTGSSQEPAHALQDGKRLGSQDARADQEPGPYVHRDTAKGGEELQQREQEHEKKKEGSDKQKSAPEEAVDDTCPLYRCPGCDKLFVVRGLLSVADLKGLNVGNRRYVDSKTARAARDAHRKDAHPHLADAQSAASVQSPRRPLAHAEQTRDGEKEPEREGARAAPADANAGDPAVLRRRLAGQHSALAPKDPRPKDPRQRGGDTVGNPVGASADAAKRPAPTADFVPFAEAGPMEGYVYKYGPSGAGYYRIVASETVSASVASVHSHSPQVGGNEQHSRVSNGFSDGASGTCTGSGGKKTIAEVIQERTRQREEAEKERIRKEVEETLRLEAEAKLREELRQMKEQLEQDRIQQQKQKEAEERERARRQQAEDERLRAELRAMKEQLDRQQRERELEWQQRRLQDANSRPGKSPPRMPRVQSPRSRITMEDRMSARVPSPPSPRRGFARRAQDDSDMEEGEIKEESPPRPTISDTRGTHAAQERHRSPPTWSSARDASPSAQDAASNCAHQATGASTEQRKAGDSEHSEPGISCKSGHAGKRRGSKTAANGSVESHANAGDVDEDREEVDDDALENSERACSPMLPSLRAPGCRVPEQEDDDDDDAAVDDDADKRKSARADKAKGAKGASGSKRKAPSGQGAAGKNKASKKAAMLKEFSRAEVRAGEALLTLYDYYYTAAQQMEKAQELDGAAPSAAQIGNNLLQKELQDAVAPRIQVGARVKVCTPQLAR